MKRAPGEKRCKKCRKEELYRKGKDGIKSESQ